MSFTSLSKEEKRRLSREYLMKTGQVGPVKDAAYYHRIIEREKAEKTNKERRREEWLRKTRTLSYRIKNKIEDIAYGIGCGIVCVFCCVFFPLAIVIGVCFLFKWAVSGKTRL